MSVKKIYTLFFLCFITNCGPHNSDLQYASSLQNPDSKKQDTKNSQDKKQSEQDGNVMKPEKTIIEVRNTNNKGEKKHK